MFEKYKYTGKHRSSNEDLVPVDVVIEQASAPVDEEFVPTPAPVNGAYTALEDDNSPIPEDLDSIPDLERPLHSAEQIDQADSPNEAFHELVTHTDSDPEQNIRNIELAVEKFGADKFSDDEKETLAEIVVESSKKLIHKPTPDFPDAFTLGFAIDTLHELDSDNSHVDTKPILNGLVTVVEKMSDPSKNEDHAVKIKAEEAKAIKDSVEEFEHLPAGHRERLMYLLDDRLREVTYKRTMRSRKIGATATSAQPADREKNIA